MKQDFNGLREKLEQLSFPSLYLFKFIVKSDLKKIAQIESLFPSEGAEIRRQESSKGAFVSISVKEVMLSADEIIEVYLKCSKIEGVIAL
ncbi:MAG: DUF493 family protein [Flavobacteriales bacterium]|nr:DUF493 family protein [Flavobacteriales bacterium]